MNRRTPAQEQVLRAYLAQRRMHYLPLDAINNVRSLHANVIAGFVAAGRLVPASEVELWRAAEAARCQINARETSPRINLRTISRKPAALTLVGATA